MAAVSRVLIVGAGLSGALTAALLRKELSHVHISVWEKARGAGGRMSTSRSDKNANCSVDMGAQYISTSAERQQKYSQIYNELFSTGLLQPFKGLIEGESPGGHSLQNFVCPKGFSALVKHFLSSAAPVDVKFESRVVSITKNPTTTSNQLVVSTESGHQDTFDAVILTVPVPQLFLLEGDIPKILNSNKTLKEQLESVSYSSRFCLGIYYPPGTTLNLPWTAKYIDGHPCLRYICVDTQKRADPQGGQSIVVHSSVPWGVEHVEESKDDVKPIMLDYVRGLLPNLPDPEFVKGHKWRYSQVRTPFPGSPGCVQLSTDPSLLVGGDGFSYSKFEGCIDSANSLVAAVLHH
ncbi:renalase-like isoform X1 [Octopus vulgaris]|uniref:Renalase-like isoform X1 n=1 Tax=Octopus vulgaris TaxID=6645 RepID=A0AA36BZ53_OCTVU|nr:renalase-like isoform X1 [Octopus vulgaris]